MKPSKNHKKREHSVREKHEIKELQKTVTPGTTQVLWKILIQKYKNVIM